MRELNVNEVQEVNGGNKLVEFVVSYVASKVVDAVLDAAGDIDWGTASYEDMMLAP
jgi:hypothetical protein